jgi:fructose-specific phosphotransferase system IIC component
MKDSIKEGTIGLAATTGGIAVSLTTVNLWLQFVSLIVGILVGLFSLILLFRKWKSNKD